MKFLINDFRLYVLPCGLAFLLDGCITSTGFNSTPPFIDYKYDVVTANKGVAIVPDSVSSLAGFITGYTVSPVLPAGLVLNAGNGAISGTPTMVVGALGYSVIATGPGGRDTTVVAICVGDATHLCNAVSPYVVYSQPYLWTSPGVAITPDTANPSEGGSITRYSISPALPAGMNFNTNTGLISGTPASTMAAVEFRVVATGLSDPPDTTPVYIGVYSSAYPKALLNKGVTRFKTVCSACHGLDAKGIPGSIPPLYHSDFLMANRHRPIHIQMLGNPNPFDTATAIIVSGDIFTGAQMPAVGGNDSEIAGVLTFVRATFNAATDYISVQEVGQVRDSLIAACSANASLMCAGVVDPTH